MEIVEMGIVQVAVVWIGLIRVGVVWVGVVLVPLPKKASITGGIYLNVTVK